MDDKKTIGVTDERAPTLDALVEVGRFSDALDAAKFAMALAIRSGAAVADSSPVVEGANTKWNVGSFDPDNSLKTFLTALYPEIDVPYRLLELLIDRGLGLVEEHGRDGRAFDPLAFLSPEDQASAS